MEVNVGWSGASLDALSPSKRGPSAHRDQTSSLLQPLQSSPPVWLTPSRVLGGDQWLAGASQSAAAAGSPLEAILASTRPPGSFKGTSLFQASQKSKTSSGSSGQATFLGSDTGTTDSSLLLKHFRKQLDAADAAKASAQLVLQDSSSLDAQFALARLTAAVLSPAAPAQAAALPVVPTPGPTAAAAAAVVASTNPGVVPGSSSLSRWQQLRQHQQPQADQQATSSQAQQQQPQPQQQQQDEVSDSETAEQQTAVELEQALTTRRQVHWFAAWRHATRQRRRQQLQEQRLADACRSHRALKAWACACFGRAHWGDIQRRPQGQPVPPQPGPSPLQAAKARIADQLHHLHLKRAALAGWAAYVAAAQQLQQERQQAVHLQATAAARAVYQVAVADRFWRLRRLHAGFTALRQAALVAARISCLHGQAPLQTKQQQQQQQQQQRARMACSTGTRQGQQPAAAAAGAAAAAAAVVCDGGLVHDSSQGGLEDKVAALLARVAAKQQQGQEGQQQQQSRCQRRPASSPVPWLESLRASVPDAPPARQGASSSTPPRPAPDHHHQQQSGETQGPDQQQQGSRLLAQACAQMDAVLAQDDPDEVLACLAALTQQLSVEALSAEGSAAEVGEPGPEQQQQQQQEEEKEVVVVEEDVVDGGDQGSNRAHGIEDLQQQQQQQQQLAGGHRTVVELYASASSAGAAAVGPASKRPAAPSSPSQRPAAAAARGSLRDRGSSAGRTVSSKSKSNSSSSRCPRTRALQELSKQRMQSRAGVAAAAGTSSSSSRAGVGSNTPLASATQLLDAAGAGTAVENDAAVDGDTTQEQTGDRARTQQAQQQEHGQAEEGTAAALLSQGVQACDAAEPGAVPEPCIPLEVQPSEEDTAAVVPPQLLLPLSAEEAQRLAALQLHLQRRERQQQALASQLQRCLVQQQVLLAGMHHARQLVARRGVRPWQRLVAWRAQQGEVAELWREKALLKGVLRCWRALLWARQYQRCARLAAARARLAAAARAVLTVRAWDAWHAWAAARRHAQQGRARAVLRAWRRRAAWVGGAAQQVAAGWARCQLQLALAGWRRVVSAQVREQLLWQLQSDQRAERFWSQLTARRVLAAWQAAARCQQQERLDQLQQQHTWSKVRCWLLEMQAAKAANGLGAAAAPDEPHGAAAAADVPSYTGGTSWLGQGGSHSALGSSSSLQARLAVGKLAGAPSAAESDLAAAADSGLPWSRQAEWHQSGGAPSAHVPGLIR